MTEPQLSRVTDQDYKVGRPLRGEAVCELTFEDAPISASVEIAIREDLVKTARKISFEGDFRVTAQSVQIKVNDASALREVMAAFQETAKARGFKTLRPQ